MHHSKSPPQSKKKPMKANRDSRFLALNRQLFYLVVYHQRKKFLLRSSNVEAVTDKSVLGLTFCMLSGAELEGKRGDLRPGAKASLASQSGEQGRCWPPWGLLVWRMPVIFGPWKGSQDIVFAGNRLSASACTGSACLVSALCCFLSLASEYECVDLCKANEKLHKEGFSR